MHAVVFTGAGRNEVVAFEERPEPVPTGDDVLLEVRYAALNGADLAQRAGSYPAPAGAPADIPGIETSGVVIGRGPTARRFDLGDRVFGIVGGGGLASRVVVNERHLVPVPPSLADAGAAAVPEVFVTAHDAVFTLGHLHLGEVLGVTGANGGVGTAAVQIGAAAGARVLATVRSEGVRDQVAALGAEVLAPEELATRAQELGGAHVVVELVGAPNLESDVAALGTKGRIVIVGTGAGADASLSLRTLMGKRARLIGTMLRGRPFEEKALAVQAFGREIVPHLASGRIVPLVDRIFPAAEARAAFDRMEEPGKLGKVLLDFGA